MKRWKKSFNWALYENLRQIEREEAFRLLKWAVYSLPPPWDSGWKGVGRKPYHSRALTVITIWQEIEGKPERPYTAVLERDKEHLHMLGLEHAPHRTALYRTRKRLSEEYMRRLNRKILERLKPAKKVGADATGLRQSTTDCAWSSSKESDRRGYVKLHGLFNLENRTVENIEATPGTVHECNRLEGLLRRAGCGRVFVSDAEFSSKQCLRELWRGVDQGLLEGFVVRGNPTWHRVLYRLQGLPVGGRRRVKLWGREVWVYKVRLGRETAYLLSSSSRLGPEVYQARWGIEVYFRDAKHLLPSLCFHTLAARLAVFSSSIVASAVLRLLQISKGSWKSRLVNLAFRLLEFLAPTPPLTPIKDPG